MSLIKCHECSGQVSDHARTCPKCGAPVIATIKRRQKAALIGLGVRLGFGLIFAIIIWVTFHHFMDKAMAPLKAMQQQQQTPH
ncbi:MAG TPA: hypothetical protein VFC17_06495 [Candidatus Limnocylindrales bacterium]|nr:hypothetical protein [Candidatus Limnocylindrales bacterium]